VAVAVPSCPTVDERVAHLADDGTRILTLKFCERKGGEGSSCIVEGGNGQDTH
jgi:hypothetical protein